MMHRHEKSDPVVVAVKSPNKTGLTGSGGDGVKDGGQGECGPALHVPDTEPGKRVTDAGAHTESRRFSRHYPRWEPDAGKLHVRICAGGAG